MPSHALAIYGRRANHPGIASILGKLGTTYVSMGNLNEGLKMEHESLDMLRAIYGHGANHQSIASSLSSLGRIFELLGLLRQKRCNVSSSA